jgi:hypothetical protein
MGEPDLGIAALISKVTKRESFVGSKMRTIAAQYSESLVDKGPGTARWVIYPTQTVIQVHSGHPKSA